MGSKRTRNRYPRLPESVTNLLALHGLRAVPEKIRTWRNGAAVSWGFNIVPDKPAPPAGAFGRHVNGWRPLFQGRSGDSLNDWMARVQRYENSGIGTFIEYSDFGNIDFGSNASAQSIWMDEVGKLHAMALSGTRRPPRK